MQQAEQKREDSGENGFPPCGAHAAGKLFLNFLRLRWIGEFILADGKLIFLFFPFERRLCRFSGFVLWFPAAEAHTRSSRGGFLLFRFLVFQKHFLQKGRAQLRSLTGRRSFLLLLRLSIDFAGLLGIVVGVYDPAATDHYLVMEQRLAGRLPFPIVPCLFFRLGSELLLRNMYGEFLRCGSFLLFLRRFLWGRPVDFDLHDLFRCDRIIIGACPRIGNGRFFLLLVYMLRPEFGFKFLHGRFCGLWRYGLLHRRSRRWSSLLCLFPHDWARGRPLHRRPRLRAERLLPFRFRRGGLWRRPRGCRLAFAFSHLPDFL